MEIGWEGGRGGGLGKGGGRGGEGRGWLRIGGGGGWGWGGWWGWGGGGWGGGGWGGWGGGVREGIRRKILVTIGLIGLSIVLWRLKIGWTRGLSAGGSAGGIEIKSLLAYRVSSSNSNQGQKVVKHKATPR